MPHRLKNIDRNYVMVVDDDTDDRMVTMLCLQHENVMAVGAENGLQALKFLVEACKQGKLPHCIFLDLNMPVMDGWELMSVIRLMPNAIQNIPIVLATGENIPDNDLYTVLRKPYSIEQLMEQIKKANTLLVKKADP